MYAYESNWIRRGIGGIRLKNSETSNIIKKSFFESVRDVSIQDIDKVVEIKKFMNKMGVSFFSRSLLYDMAEHDAMLLVYIIQLQYVEPTLLTFVAEIAGEAIILDSIIVPELVKLLNHEKAFVREGAVYGLKFHKPEDVKKILTKHLENERSKAVQEAILETIADLSWA
jgi:hypothetical protein